MKTRVDHAGERFGHLTIIGRSPGNRKPTLWRCRCVCGKEIVAQYGNLRKGDWTSCGCKKAARSRAQLTVHGEAAGERSAEYRIWMGMNGRCRNPKRKNYARYGGRGIQVCDRWQNGFAAFLEDMGRRPSPTHSIDRFPDPDGNYEPGNCRWATSAQQIENKSKQLRVILNGKVMPLATAASLLGISYWTAYTRYRKGQPIGPDCELDR